MDFEYDKIHELGRHIGILQARVAIATLILENDEAGKYTSAKDLVKLILHTEITEKDIT